MKPEELKREKARNLRYRKAIAKDLNLCEIRTGLEDIISECYDVQYYVDGDDDTLLNALDGDEDDAYEFRMMFSDLVAECEQMREDLENEYVPECFDSFFTAVSTVESVLGYDAYEGDYFGLGSRYEEELARKEARKKISHLTKEQLLEGAQVCFRIYQAYIGIRHRYDCIKAALDILRNENTGYLQMVKNIEEGYENAEKEGFELYGRSVRLFDNMAAALPQTAWLQ